MPLTPKQYQKLRSLVYHECGINLHEGKLNLLQARLTKRLRKTGIKNINEYIKLLDQDSSELINFLDAVSTNHTFFFRENYHFTCLTKEHDHIWCAASSSGEEPYSIAIYCLEKGFTPHILATDISTHVLHLGKRGLYPLEKTKNTDQYILRKYFQKGQGRWEGSVRVKKQLMEMVTFKRLNLINDPLPACEFDVIFCRNLLIYFDNATKEKVVNKVYQVLKPKGILIIGGAESLNNIKHMYRYIKPSIYVKPF